MRRLPDQVVEPVAGHVEPVEGGLQHVLLLDAGLQRLGLGRQVQLGLLADAPARLSGRR